MMKRRCSSDPILSTIPPFQLLQPLPSFVPSVSHSNQPSYCITSVNSTSFFSFSCPVLSHPTHVMHPSPAVRVDYAVAWGFDPLPSLLEAVPLGKPSAAACNQVQPS
mmetsp:Transcript_47640/g.77458  ORF Transcript_47640/g.77458 Transcript_47640/m.77458 type:complete len:107 (+) Transcript_47640:753-1073(+)